MASGILTPQRPDRRHDDRRKPGPRRSSSRVDGLQRPAAPRPPRPPSLTAGVLLALHDALARALQKAIQRRRLLTLLVCFLVLTLLMGWRLVHVQVVAASDYAELALRQTQRELPLPAARGAITDRDGAPLAMSLTAATVYANPQIIQNAEIDGVLVDPYVVASELIEQMHDAPEQVDVPTVTELVELLESDREFVYVGRQLPRDIGDAIEQLALPGVGVHAEPTRVYPAERIAAQVVGWAGLDGNGLAGVEQQYEDALGGVPGMLRLERAPGGLEISAAPREVIPASPGLDVRLTIDREVQFSTEEILLEAVSTYQAIGGSAVVMDIRTGEILAMASVPSVAPTAYAAAEPYDRRNRALTDVFEPGSVNKVIAIAGALEEGVVGPEQVHTVPWRIEIPPETFHDATRHPTERWSTREIVARSSNVGTIQIAQALGREDLYDYVTAFGLGMPTGLDFPGESDGLLAHVDRWHASSLPTIAIGQGVSATLVQVAQVFAVIANDGVYQPPMLVQGTVAPDGAFTRTHTDDPHRVVSADTARTVAQMLVEVVESPVGTGALAAVPGYRVGGKTGTAQKALEGELGYAEDRYIGTFAGFAPAEDPRLVVAVMLDEPTPHYGGQSAAPVFSDIMEFALRDQRVQPIAAPFPLPAGHRLGGTFAVRPPEAEPAEDAIPSATDGDDAVGEPTGVERG